jgi:hypothetical protein
MQHSGMQEAQETERSDVGKEGVTVTGSGHSIEAHVVFTNDELLRAVKLGREQMAKWAWRTIQRIRRKARRRRKMRRGWA